METIAAEKRHSAILQKALILYLQQLYERPVLTKAITSGVIAGLADAIAQYIVLRQRALKTDKEKEKADLNLRSIAAFAAFGGCVTAPLAHYFYKLLDLIVPPTANRASLIRLIIDRGLFAPFLILLFFYFVTIAEGGSVEDAEKKIKQRYWAAVKMNWKVWTPIQYINLNYVPLEYRVLFGNLFGLLWSVYLSTKRRG